MNRKSIGILKKVEEKDKCGIEREDEKDDE